MNLLVKIIRDDGGVLINNGYWHLNDPCSDGVWGMVLCTGEVYGAGESAVEYEIKTAQRGGITCPECLRRIRLYKSVKL